MHGPRTFRQYLPATMLALLLAVLACPYPALAAEQANPPDIEIASLQLENLLLRIEAFEPNALNRSELAELARQAFELAQHGGTSIQKRVQHSVFKRTES